MSFSIGKNTFKNLVTLRKSKDPRSDIIIDAVLDFIHYTPVDFCIIGNGGYRTAEEQNELFKKDVTDCDGYKIKSKHQSGLAADLVPWINGKAVWDEDYARVIAGAFMTYCKLKGIPMRSGFDWNEDGVLTDGWDPYHMEWKE